MEEFSVLSFGLYILFFAIIDSSASKQTCPFPNLPEKGNYSPKLMTFQLGEDITYSCDDAHILVGSETSRCKSDGKWSHPTPFCDRKVGLKNPYVRLKNGSHQSSPQVTDSNRSSCFPFNRGEKLEVSWEKQKVVYAVRLYLGRGNTNIAISTGRTRCGENFVKYLDSSQLVSITCNENKELTTTLVIQDKSDTGVISAICEVEVYLKEDDGCENPPKKEIPHGYFEVSRLKAQLICVDGYKSDFNRLVCEGKTWTDQMLVCEEVLCDPQLNLTRPTDGEWIFLDPVKKISTGTKRQLKCNTGYRKTGHPDIIECQKSGTWTKTTAVCVENEKPKVSTQTIIYASVGAGVVFVIIVLLGAIIFFIRKQRDKQVVVIYKSPGEGSMISGSDADSSAYYETIHNTATLPASSSLPMPHILPDGYALPMDSKHTLKKNPTPADIAFCSFKQSSLYNT